MPTILKPFIELRKDELAALHDIHRVVYAQFTLEDWIQRHQKPYNGKHQLCAQLYYEPEKVLAGYSIFTQPAEIGNDLWSKIIEVGSESGPTKLANFLRAQKELFEHCAAQAYYAEISDMALHFYRFLIRHGWSHVKDVALLEKLIEVFHSGVGASIRRDSSGLQITRQSTIRSSYASYPVILIPNKF